MWLNGDEEEKEQEGEGMRKGRWHYIFFAVSQSKHIQISEEGSLLHPAEKQIHESSSRLKAEVEST